MVFSRVVMSVKRVWCGYWMLFFFFFLLAYTRCRDSTCGELREDVWLENIYISVTVMKFIQTRSRGSFNLWITRYKHKAYYGTAVF